MLKRTNLSGTRKMRDAGCRENREV